MQAKGNSALASLLDHASNAREWRLSRWQVLVCTSTLAWGVNFPAHLVVVKGTEYYDGKSKRYVDFPITDVLQMMGRAGRPQFDQAGVAVILVHEPKKSFYKKVSQHTRGGQPGAGAAQGGHGGDKHLLEQALLVSMRGGPPTGCAL